MDLNKIEQMRYIMVSCILSEERASQLNRLNRILDIMNMLVEIEKNKKI